MKNEQIPFNAKTDIWKFTEPWTRLRLIGPTSSYHEFWISTRTSYRELKTQKFCLDWDPDTETFISDVCPYRKAGLKGRTVYLSNAIIRGLQQEERSRHRPCSPVRVIRIPPRLRENLSSLEALNRQRTKSGQRKHFDLAHPRYGRDINIKANPDAPYGYYDVRPLEHTRLTEDELAYDQFSLAVERETLKQARMAWKRLKSWVDPV